MNIHYYKNQLKKARVFLKAEKSKRRRERNPDLIKRIENGMVNLRAKIKVLREQRKKKGSKGGRNEIYR